jgi:hypothetical protein
MASIVPDTEIIAIDRVDIAVEPLSWAFSVARREEIGRHFAQRQRRQPALWNGRVLLLNRYTIRDGVLRGVCFETDYASFLAWRDWDFADPEVFNIFAAAALRGADGGYLVGEMAPHTANAGRLYFPCGTPDPKDLRAGALDLAASLGRELLEETGITIGTLAAEPGWSFVRDRGFLALLKPLAAPQSADELRSQIVNYLAREVQPEFSDIRIVRDPADLVPTMPRFVTAFLSSCWS